MKYILASLFFCSLYANSFAQDTITNMKGSNYRFTVVDSTHVTDVKNQQHTGTCWSFSTLGFFESELLREGKGYYHLAPMYVVRKVYFDKAVSYVRMHGKTNFSQGGEGFDIPYVYKKYGMVPYEAYTALSGNDSIYNQSELVGVIKAMLDVYIKAPQRKLTNHWRNAIRDVLDEYLGATPEHFEYNGKKYTPKSFADHLGLDMDNYVSITSYKEHPFYSKFILRIPDNWQWKKSYNVPINDMMAIMDNALNNGYTIAWGADVSNKGFSFYKGLAIVPEDPSTLKKPKDDDSTSVYAFTDPVPQKEISNDMRQDAYDHYINTDDHGMQIVGKLKDQNGDVYYKVKNSWGTKNFGKGYFYASKAYVEYRTMSFVINKNAIPKKISKKLGL